jgi:hypothetical protein
MSGPAANLYLSFLGPGQDDLKGRSWFFGYRFLHQSFTPHVFPVSPFRIVSSSGR